MTDPRIKEAQQLFWEVETLRLDVPHNERVIVTKLHRMAQLHEEIAKDRLGRHDADGWIDLFAAITAWGQAGCKATARSLLRFGEQAAAREAGREVLLSELESFESWLQGLKPTRWLPPLVPPRPGAWASP